jgi:hypothetical protein
MTNAAGRFLDRVFARLTGDKAAGRLAYLEVSEEGYATAERNMQVGKDVRLEYLFRPAHDCWLPFDEHPFDEPLRFVNRPVKVGRRKRIELVGSSCLARLFRLPRIAWNFGSGFFDKWRFRRGWLPRLPP